jgi:hypothetical protein
MKAVLLSDQCAQRLIGTMSEPTSPPMWTIYERKKKRKATASEKNGPAAVLSMPSEEACLLCHSLEARLCLLAVSAKRSAVSKAQTRKRLPLQRRKNFLSTTRL